MTEPVKGYMRSLIEQSLKVRSVGDTFALISRNLSGHSISRSQISGIKSSMVSKGLIVVADTSPDTAETAAQISCATLLRRQIATNQVQRAGLIAWQERHGVSL